MLPNPKEIHLLLILILSICTEGISQYRAEEQEIIPYVYDYRDIKPPKTRARYLQPGPPGPDGSCARSVSTPETAQITRGHGIIFAIKSRDDDDDGLIITSLGFRVDPDDFPKIDKVEYEIYVLKVDGNFNSPDFDYRGKTEYWDMIASGEIFETNLTTYPSTYDPDDPLSRDFFQIPFDSFNKARATVPANGGMRSFYIATKTNVFIYGNAVGKRVYDQMDLVQSDDVYAPEILVGEFVSSYPWDSNFFFDYAITFVGEVHYEAECDSLAPSISASQIPTAQPSIQPSQEPSTQPSHHPSVAPSEAPSFLPSLSPSQSPSLAPSSYTEISKSALFVQFTMECKPDEVFPPDQSEYIAATVQAFAEKGVEKQESGIALSNINAKVVDVVCIPPQRRKLMTNPIRTEAIYDHRRLPTGSSALDFSVLVTGEYRPPWRKGEKRPEQRVPDIGAVAEDSINRDRKGFVRDLKQRAEVSTNAFEQVTEDDLAPVVSITIDDEEATTFTRAPTPRPTPSPTTQKEDSTDTVILICIIVVSGIIFLLGVYLFFRHAERRARRERARKMERLKVEKEMKRRDRERREERTMDQLQSNPIDSMVKGPPHYGNPNSGIYGHPPPPPSNYYAGSAPPQNYNYNYGGPESQLPPPSYGQTYPGHNPQSYPYPPPPQQQPPSGQGANYQPQRAVSWKDIPPRESRLPSQKK
eukprot:CAMPEP_0183711732 /NCGR_PEP_ID=MMETSP0737-20130205/7155_1 /TAXON_ID=385413 /ORGANISM="Thalassiosira miniscula, Strain CCMP1093" /LENGTH=698 /DNA_ID=CAMNT_0025940299 /DNA_START=157 /DNA_END=2253 /DNA_ORIENTATION=+